MDPSHETRTPLEAAQDALATSESLADALKTTEIRYRRLFEAARDGILLLDVEFGRITDANPFMTELLGYSHAELMGKELWEIGLLADKQAGQEAFAALQKDGYIRYDDLPLRNRNGQEREVEFVSNVYRENGHIVIQSNIRDITERKRIEASLANAAKRNERIAETLQRSMLLASPSNQFPRIQVETFYAAALNEAEVGGDFFDAFALTGYRVAIVVGDVSGKGLPAAARTAEVKYALRAFLHEHPEPASALAYLNDFICETHRHDEDSTESFIALALAVMDSDTGETVFSAAGAWPTQVLRANGEVEPVDIVGTPLGIVPKEAYIEKRLVIAPGETVIMSTDGIAEARRDNEFFGLEGIAEAAKTTGPQAPLNQLVQAIYNSARDFARNLMRDDVCLLLARRN